MSLRDQDEDDVVDAELVADERLPVPAARPKPEYLVDQHTVLRPGQAIPTDDGPVWTERDLRISEETARDLEDAEPENTGEARETAMRPFRAWCAVQGRVAKPCTTATYTEYGRYLISRELKVGTIRSYMSLIRTSMPKGQQPDNSLYLRLLKKYRQENKRASRKRQAFPITLPYLVPMMLKAEEVGRPIGWRDAALLAFGYRFLSRRIEAADIEIEDLTITDGLIVVWLAKDKAHQDEEQKIHLRDRADLQLVPRMRRWLAHLASLGVTTGPVFRHLQKDGKLANRTNATKRGDHLRGHTVNERVKHWFTKAGLITDGRPVTAHGLRAGGATDLGLAGATDQELEEAGRWRPGSAIPRRDYVRPAQQAQRDPFSKVPLYGSAPEVG